MYRVAILAAICVTRTRQTPIFPKLVARLDHWTLPGNASNRPFMPQTSVIIPTHNRPDLLPRAVESAQLAGHDLEVVVVDDASTDETASVCQSLKDIKYVRVDHNQGVAGARNVGLLHSEGEFVTFLDDDDRRLPGSIDLQARVLAENPEAGFVCGGMILTGQDYEPTGVVTHPRHPSGDVFWKVLEFDFPAMGLSTLIRKECLLRIGLLRQHLIGLDDWDLLARLAEIYPAIVIPEAVGLYRYPTPHSAQGSSRATLLYRVAQHQWELFGLPRALAAPKKLRRAVRRQATTRIADTLLSNAARLVSKGELGPAIESVGIALRLRPSRVCRQQAYRKLVHMWMERNPKLYSN